MGGITDYKPIDDGVGTNENWYTDEFPVGAAFAQRLANNASWLAQNRLNKSSKTWDCTASNDSSTSTFNASAGDATKILGYAGNVGAVSTNDIETIGFQISSHPGAPLALPLGWRLSPGAGKVKVRLAMKISNAQGAIYAALVSGNGAVSPAMGLPEVDITTFSPLVAGQFFNAEIRAEDSYQTVELTSTNGTSGYSYYELTIDLSRFAGTATREAAYDEDATVVLFFQSGVDLTSPETLQIGASSPDAVVAALTTGNRVIRTNGVMSKYAGIRNPGKYHRVAKFDYNAGTPKTETWHHVVQLRPYEFDTGAFAANNPETFVLWPAIPPAGVPPSLVGGGGGMNAGALEGTGLLNGDSFTLYPITQFDIYSVTVEEEYD